MEGDHSVRFTDCYSQSQDFSLQADYGSIEVGKVADLVILDRDPLLDIRHVHEVKGWSWMENATKRHSK